MQSPLKNYQHCENPGEAKLDTNQALIKAAFQLIIYILCKFHIFKYMC